MCLPEFIGRLPALFILRCLVYASLAFLIPASLFARDRVGVQWGAFPVFNVTTDLGVTAGALAQRFDYGEAVLPFDNLWTLQATAATRGPKTALLEYEQTGLGDGSWRIYSGWNYRDNRFQSYYGLGPDSQLDPALQEAVHGYDYTLKEFETDQILRKKVAEGTELQGGLSIQSQRQQPTDALSAYQRDFGPDSRTRTFGMFTLGVVMERRDSEFVPSRGTYSAASVGWSPSWLDSSGGWGKAHLDWRGYLPVFPQRWLTLASQLRYSWTSENAPLQDKARLGSLGTLRGLPFNRYISNQSASARFEARSVAIRWELFGLPLKAGGGIFVDTGKIGENLESLAGGRLHSGWGVCAFGSYFTDDFLGSADLGFSEGQTALYLRLGHAF